MSRVRSNMPVALPISPLVPSRQVLLPLAQVVILRVTARVSSLRSRDLRIPAAKRVSAAKALCTGVASSPVPCRFIPLANPALSHPCIDRRRRASNIPRPATVHLAIEAASNLDLSQPHTRPIRLANPVLYLRRIDRRFRIPNQVRRGNTLHLFDIAVSDPAPSQPIPSQNRVSTLRSIAPQRMSSQAPSNISLLWHLFDPARNPLLTGLLRSMHLLPPAATVFPLWFQNPLPRSIVRLCPRIKSRPLFQSSTAAKSPRHTFPPNPPAMPHHPHPEANTLLFTLRQPRNPPPSKLRPGHPPTTLRLRRGDRNMPVLYPPQPITPNPDHLLVGPRRHRRSSQLSMHPVMAEVVVVEAPPRVPPCPQRVPRRVGVVDPTQVAVLYLDKSRSSWRLEVTLSSQRRVHSSPLR